MNLPNKLTVFRMILIVPFLVMLLGGNVGWFESWGPYTDYIALAIFLIASVTDWIDGKIARKYNLITNFGKLMDPIADKLLVCSAMIALVELERIPAWVVIILIGREFLISGFRLVAATQDVVIAAGYWGKIKTTMQMLMVSLMILNLPGLQVVTENVMWLALVLAIISLIDYFAKNGHVLKENDSH